MILQLLLGHTDGFHGVENNPDVLASGGESHLHLDVLPRPESLHRGRCRGQYWLTELCRAVSVSLSDEIERVGETVDRDGVAGPPLVITLAQAAFNNNIRSGPIIAHLT